jgi:hypothetical protein
VAEAAGEVTLVGNLNVDFFKFFHGARRRYDALSNANLGPEALLVSE